MKCIVMAKRIETLPRLLLCQTLFPTDLLFYVAVCPVSYLICIFSEVVHGLFKKLKTVLE